MRAGGDASGQTHFECATMQTFCQRSLFVSRVISSQNEAEWLQKRRGMLQASEAAKYMGCSPFGTVDDLYDEKAGLSEPADIGDKPWVVFGKRAEEHIRAMTALYFPQWRIEYDRYGIYTPEHDPELEGWFGATLDGVIYDENLVPGILEIKTGSFRSFFDLKQNWGTQAEPRIPTHYYCQTLHQLLAFEEARFVVVAGVLKRDPYKPTDQGMPEVSWNFRTYTREEAEKNGDLAEVRKRAIWFWDCVRKKERPQSTVRL